MDTRLSITSIKSTTGPGFLLVSYPFPTGYTMLEANSTSNKETSCLYVVQKTFAGFSTGVLTPHRSLFGNCRPPTKRCLVTQNGDGER